MCACVRELAAGANLVVSVKIVQYIARLVLFTFLLLRHADITLPVHSHSSNVSKDPIYQTTRRHILYVLLILIAAICNCNKYRVRPTKCVKTENTSGKFFPLKEHEWCLGRAKTCSTVTQLVPSKRRHLLEQITRCNSTEDENVNPHRLNKFKSHYLDAVTKQTAPHLQKFKQQYPTTIKVTAFYTK